MRCGGAAAVAALAGAPGRRHHAVMPSGGPRPRDASGPRRAGRLDARLAREQAIARRIALVLAAALVAALLGPWVVGYFAA
ncbi:MAG: hypothetical protein BroJett026_22430 [Betaproteobacteria bacterium]|nr:MAG: hypothetical protein BroJett026_22430 [Betaproteobacteria bacterium]